MIAAWRLPQYNERTMQAETAEPYRIRLVVQRTNDSFKVRRIEPDGQESHTLAVVFEV